MSWFFGCLQKSGVKSADYLGANSPSVKIASGPISISGGGPSDTFLHKATGSESGWMVCGTGIRCRDSSASILTENDWAEILAGNFDPSLLDGHFAIVKWNCGRIELFNDAFGIRRLYAVDAKDAIWFSTDLFRLQTVLENPSINFNALAGKWNCGFSFDISAAFLNGVEKLGPCARANISKNGLSHLSTLWSPAELGCETVFDEKLFTSLITAPIRADRQMLFSLSGGLDSRTMLAELLPQNLRNWKAVTIGERDLPDLKIAAEIAAREGIELDICEPDLSDPALVFDSMKKAVVSMEHLSALHSANYFMSMGNYSGKNYCMIDGAFGEFSRRLLGNQLLYSGRKALAERNSAAVAEFFVKRRPPIFTPDLIDKMRVTAFEQTRTAVSLLPPARESELGSLVDVILARYRIGVESLGHMDSIVQNYMPFVQPTFVNHLLSLKTSLKMDSAINRAIIHSRHPSLEKIPLIYDEMRVPYFTSQSAVLSKVCGSVLRRLGKRYHSETPRLRLMLVRDQILDRLNSDAVRTCPLYDYPFVKESVESFFSNFRIDKLGVVESWLAFDFLREAAGV